jgi:hypothetical protein
MLLLSTDLCYRADAPAPEKPAPETHGAAAKISAGAYPAIIFAHLYVYTFNAQTAPTARLAGVRSRELQHLCGFQPIPRA